MGSEAPAATRIFFKDKKNELKGPFTERKVQEWYRDGWFAADFPFYFTKSDSSPDDSTSSFTLDELLAHNGVGAPFRLPVDSESAESIRAKSELRLRRLEEEVRSLRISCEEVLRVKARLDELEAKMKSLDAQSPSKTNEPSAAAAAAASAAPKTRQPDKLSVQTVKDLCDFYVHILENFRYGKDPKISRNDEKIVAFENILTGIDTDQKKTLFNELVRRIEKNPKKYFFCSFCKRFIFNARQSFMHLASEEHTQKIARISGDFLHVNSLLWKMAGVARVNKLFEEESAQVRIHQENMKTWKRNPAELWPGGYDGSCGCAVRNFMIDTTVPIHKQAELVFDWLNESDGYMYGMREAFTTNRVGCGACQLLLANADEYYKHLQTFDHVRKAGSFDGDTVAVNLNKRNMIRDLPWPEDSLDA